MKSYTWQSVAVAALIIAGAVALAKLNMPDLAKVLVSVLIGALALVTQVKKDGGEA